AAVAHVVRACDGSHVLLFKGQIALYPGDALLVAGTGAGLVARAAGCFVVILPCWHFVPPVGAALCGRPVLCVAGKEYTRKSDNDRTGRNATRRGEACLALVGVGYPYTGQPPRERGRRNAPARPYGSMLEATP